MQIVSITLGNSKADSSCFLMLQLYVFYAVICKRGDKLYFFVPSSTNGNAVISVRDNFYRDTFFLFPNFLVKFDQMKIYSMW